MTDHGMVPPHDKDAETCVLGSIFREPMAVHEVIASGLRPEDFYHLRHQTIYAAVLDLYADGETPDVVTVNAKLVTQGRQAEAGAPDYLTDVWSQVVTAANLGGYVRIVREKSMLRRLIAACRAGEEAGFRAEGRPEEVVDSVSHAVYQVALDAGGAKAEPMAVTVRSVLDDLDERIANQFAPPGLRSGWPDLDDHTNGFQDGQLIILAARPSVGKTSAALNVALHAAIKESVPTLVFSMEMDRKQIATNMLCMLAGVQISDVARGWIVNDAAALDRLNEHAVRLSKAKLFVDDQAGLDVLQLRAKSRHMVQHENVGLVVVDYIQLMRGRADAENKEQELASISFALKSLARDLKVPVLALAQLNREVEKRETPKPRLSDLRGSGSLEQDADVVLMLYREDYYKDKDDAAANQDEVDATIIIAKNRIGKTGEVTLRFRKRYLQFVSKTDLAEPEDFRTGRDPD